MTFTREGSCLGCGQHCCAEVLLPVSPEAATALRAGLSGWTVLETDDPGTVDWLGYHGLGLVVHVPAGAELRPVGEATFAVLPIPCKHLLPSGRCAVYGTDARPSICDEFPTSPLHLTTLSAEGQAACGYSFVET